MGWDCFKALKSCNFAFKIELFLQFCLWGWTVLLYCLLLLHLPLNIDWSFTVMVCYVSSMRNLFLEREKLHHLIWVMLLQSCNWQWCQRGSHCYSGKASVLLLIFSFGHFPVGWNILRVHFSWFIFYNFSGFMTTCIILFRLTVLTNMEFSWK